MTKLEIMKEDSSIDFRLRQLLSRFVDLEILTPDLIVKSRRYLFDQHSYIPFFTNTELYDTVVYLKEVMTINCLHNVDEIICYYEEKKKSVRIFIDEVVIHDSGKYAQMNDLDISYDIHWEKPVPQA